MAVSITLANASTLYVMKRGAFTQERDLRRELFRFAAVLRAGTLAPFLRASERPIAMACLRLFTLPPWPFLPRRSVPRLRRRIALSTDFPAPAPYLRPREDFLRGEDLEDFFLAAMLISILHVQDRTLVRFFARSV